MRHFTAPHPVRMYNHRLKTLITNCPLDGEAYIRTSSPSHPWHPDSRHSAVSGLDHVVSSV